MRVLILALLFVCLFATKLDKIQPEVIAELDLNGGYADIFVDFNEKVNFNELSKGQNYDTMESDYRGKLVFESLLEVATWTQAPVKSYLQQRNVEFQSFYIDNLINIPRANKRMIDYLAAQPEVRRIYQNVKINLEELEKPRPAENTTKQIEKGIAWIKAPAVWRHTKGKGVLIANSDTGVTHTHEALRNTYAGKEGDNHNYHWWDGSTPRSNVPVDGHGHGTHCMGTKVGYTSSEQIGVAPEASWINCRSLGPGASARTVLSCLQFFLAPTDLQGNNPQPNKRPHVTSHSYLCNGCQLDNAVTALLKAGVEVVVAAGNSGSRCQSITEPAAYADTLAVAALNPNSDQAAFFSSRGPARNNVKPQVSAPGVNVRSCGRVSGYVQMSGTSMACPHVAGAIGLLWAGKTSLQRNIEKTREIFYQTAKKQEDAQCGTAKAPNNVYGWGTIDLEKAWAAASKL